MKKEFKIWHLLVVFFLLLIFLRSGLIYNLFLLITAFAKLLIDNPELAIQQLDLNLFDFFASFIFLFAAPLILFFKRAKFNFLFLRTTFTDSVLVALLIFIIFTPIAAPFQFDMQNNISVSNLLPPLSVKNIVHLKSGNDNKNSVQNFVHLRDLVFNKEMTGKYFIADSIANSDQNSGDIIIYQKSKKQIISAAELKNKNITPEVSTLVFLLGTDEFARDIFSRLIYGTRLSLFVGLSSVLISFAVGLLFGFAAGYLGGITDTILNRTSDIFLSFPIIFLIILIVGLFGNSIATVVIVLGFSGWMNLFKIARNEAASLKNKDFIITAKMLGFSNLHILFKEMFPIMLPSIIVTLVLQYGNVIIAESALSYLGLGLGNNYPSWGAMIESGQYYLSQAWWISFFPCLFLFLTLLTANHFGNKMEISFNIKTK
ncbi:MAG: ABC transporter permease [Bacteroidetes bacterium]|nr:ABC transporter permease [Bacteroidota bacterium]